jgi:hypothetical protein
VAAATGVDTLEFERGASFAEYEKAVTKLPPDCISALRRMLQVVAQSIYLARDAQPNSFVHFLWAVSRTVFFVSVGCVTHSVICFCGLCHAQCYFVSVGRAMRDLILCALCVISTPHDCCIQ